MLSFWEFLLAVMVGTAFGIHGANMVLLPIQNFIEGRWARWRARRAYPALIAEIALKHTENLNALDKHFDEEVARAGVSEEERLHIETHRNLARKGAEFSYGLACRAAREEAGIED